MHTLVIDPIDDGGVAVPRAEPSGPARHPSPIGLRSWWGSFLNLRRMTLGARASGRFSRRRLATAQDQPSVSPANDVVFTR